MLRNLVEFSLRFRLVVLLLAATLVVGGSMSVRDAPWDVFPEFAPPQIVVQTEAAGLSAEEVERLVTVPLESAVSGVTRLRTLRSSSIPGLSVLTLVFEDGAEILNSRQMVNERLAEVAARLPEGVEPPRMTPFTASVSRLLNIGLTSSTPEVSLMDLRTLADWTLQRRLQAVPGVARVEVFGGEVRQYQVLVRPEKLQQHHLTLDQVLAAARRATGFGGAGFIDTANQRLPIRQRTRIDSPADLGEAPVACRHGVPIALSSVAEVRIGACDKVGDATINGRPGVLLVVHKQPAFNTLAVTEQVQRTLDELAGSLPQGVTLDATLFRQATFIERAIGNLSQAILLGCALAVLVLLAFLAQWRTAAISLAAIPLSLLGAVVVLRAFGASLNTMTLGGLAIAIGVVVDDAIVDVENVVRRLRDNARLPRPLPTFGVILEASLEVRSAVVHATFIVILVFLPVLFLKGLAGSFFRPLGYAYIAAILISLLVAITVTPAMCLALLRPGRLERAREPLVLRIVKNAYRRFLPLVLDHGWLTLAAAVLLFATSAAVVPFLGGEFLPDFRESNFVIMLMEKPDSSLGESVRAGRLVSQRLRAIPGVLSVVQQIGRAELSEDTWGPNTSEVTVVVDDAVDYDSLLRQIDAELKQLPGQAFQIKQFLRERMDEVLTGVTADIVIRVVGPDLDQLRGLAGSIAAAARPVEGVANLRVEEQVELPQVEILLEPKKAARYGLSVGELNQAIQALLRGTRVGQVYREDGVFDVVVRLHSEARSSPEILGRLPVDAPSEDQIPLEGVATVHVASAANVINRDNGSRRMLVTCNARGRDVAGVMRDLRRRIESEVALPPSGYHLEYGGEFEARSLARRQLLLWSSVALVGIFILLYLDFQTVPATLLVMLSVPLACVGTVAAVLLGGGDISLGSMVGLVTVFGVAVRNGILLVSHYRHLAQVEGLPFGRELIVRGAMERLAPILMTASTAALSLLPLVVLGDRPGYEIEHPMAVAIVGGLVSSTLLSLIVLPVCYQWLGVMAKPGREGKE